MSWRRGLSLLGVILVLGGCERLLERGLRARMLAPPSVPLNDDALHLILCGTGSPLPDPERAGPCTAVIAAGQFYLIDVGPGAAESLQLRSLPLGSLSGVLLTHFHSDHIADLGETVFQSWAADGRSQPLPVHGPPGVEQVVRGFEQAYALDLDYRVAHHGAPVMPPAGGRPVARVFALPAPDEASVLIEEAGLRVSAFVVDHAPVRPAVGYRFEFGGRSLVISGDTSRSDSLLRHAAGADLLVHEALSADLMQLASRIASDTGRNRLSRISADVIDYHTTPREAQAIGEAAGVGLVVLTHGVPPLRNRLVERVFRRGLDTRRVIVGRDGMHFRLPVGSSAVERSRLEID